MITESFLYENSKYFHPLFSPDLNQENTFILDLTSQNEELRNLDYSDTHSLGEYVFRRMREERFLYAYGGYMEDRELYRRSPLFAGEGKEARSIHLGCDVWTSAGTPVFLPLDGTVHSFQDNSTYGDYGPTIIMTHQLQEHTFHTLYGHLMKESLQGLTEGMHISAGATLCHIGDAPGNGDWPPHLHFQVITDMQGLTGDYPGVAFVRDKERYRRLCPDPGAFFPKLKTIESNPE